MKSTILYISSDNGDDFGTLGHNDNIRFWWNATALHNEIAKK